MATSSNITDNATPVADSSAESVCSTIPPDIATPAAAASTKQPKSVPKKRRRVFRRMIYGFAFSPDQLEEWGRQRFGDTDDEKVLRSYSGKSMSPLFFGCRRLWRRTSKHIITNYTGPRRHESDWCLSFADNISPDTANPPPREIINQMKENLGIKQEPQWYLFYDGD